MRPLKITMQAFGSYAEKTTISFEDLKQNLFLITGDTGSGKTTIFEAIVYALYGKGGSSSFKKSSDDFQSQYASLDVEPYVELTFSDGPDGEIWRVRRVPAHLQTRRRASKTGGDLVQKQGYVELTMPDGSVCPEKEADAKLVEIVGLNKDQFMQVAMIAQGEFMDLLSAGTEKRKGIFQHLFHTERYAALVEELNVRQKEKDGAYQQASSRCRELVKRVRIPDDFEKSEELKNIQKDAAAGDLSQLDVFANGLGDLCQVLMQAAETAASVQSEAQAAWGGRLADYQTAQELVQAFAQLDQAEKTLAGCREQEEEISRKKRLGRQIRDAYEIQGVYEKYAEAEKQEKETGDQLQAKKRALPDLQKEAQEAAEKEEKARAESDEAHAVYHQLSEQVTQAKDALKLASEAEQKWEKDDQTLREQKEQLANAEKELETLRQEQESCRQQMAGNEDVKDRLNLWTNRCQTLEQLQEEAAQVKTALEEYEKQQASVSESQRSYEQAKQQYCAASEQYEQMHQRFLDAQAGVLARELKPDTPCPVCGSLDHPHPCVGSAEENLSKETVEAEKETVDQLRAAQQAAAENAREERGICTGKQEAYTKGLQNLRKNMRPVLSDLEGGDAEAQAADSGVEQLQTEIDRLSEAAAKEKKDLEQQEETWQALQQSLDELSGKEEKLTKNRAEAEDREQKARSAWDKSRAEMDLRKAACTYASEEEADQALLEKKTQYEQAKQACEQAKGEADAAGAEVHQTEALLQDWEEKLPELQEKTESCKKEYENILDEKDIDEAGWKGLCQAYRRTEPDKLQEEVSAFENRHAEAEGSRRTALHAVNGHARPDAEKLEQEKDQAEADLEKANASLAQIRSDSETDQDVCTQLASAMERRRQIFEEQQRLERLYSIFGGKYKNSHMDIETYVQRCYLEKILTAANRRFQQMTNGEYELRIKDARKASVGKNHGLDLVAYSYTTGKEREVNTLSGGESFMAALSLALGMADQIQENTASVHLDMLFVDEGFGSLSDNVRREAIKVLQDMAGGDKLIGIISHVTELKDEIDQKLVVTKDDVTGSHARWQE